MINMVMKINDNTLTNILKINITLLSSICIASFNILNNKYLTFKDILDTVINEIEKKNILDYELIYLDDIVYNNTGYIYKFDYKINKDIDFTIIKKLNLIHNLIYYCKYSIYDYIYEKYNAKLFDNYIYINYNRDIIIHDDVTSTPIVMSVNKIIIYLYEDRYNINFINKDISLGNYVYYINDIKFNFKKFINHLKCNHFKYVEENLEQCLNTFDIMLTKINVFKK